MDKDRKPRVPFEAHSSRRDAQRLNDLNQRAELRKQTGMPDEAQSIERDYSNPGSIITAQEWQRELTVELNDVDLGLSGFKIKGSSGSPKVIRRNDPRRKELIRQKEDIVQKKQTLREYLKGKSQASYNEMLEGLAGEDKKTGLLRSASSLLNRLDREDRVEYTEDEHELLHLIKIFLQDRK